MQIKYEKRSDSLLLCVRLANATRQDFFYLIFHLKIIFFLKPLDKNQYFSNIIYEYFFYLTMYKI